ncbi:Ig-like domain-containing protein [Pyxidicoccus caerfyrddinensis]|uniref:Ig-like domain-containing protein n=1 Tax=Pyxidicoccus caerfyrddinensis TaxID=2709663 RepID=UPI0013DBB617|nr:Ig-like domain-containing protein [Pyxidicoccus caerfyrddinensis]
MRSSRWMWMGLVCLAMGCEPTQGDSQAPPESTPRARAEQLAVERGFDLREATLVEKPGGTGLRHQLQLRGVPVWGLEAKTAQGQTHFTNARLAPGVRAETKPRVTQEQAVQAALERLADASAQLTGAQLVLLPQEERRRRADAPPAALTLPNAAHYERVVTGFTLVYRLELSTRDPDFPVETPWIADVDALSGQVLKLTPLRFDAGDFRTVTGYGLNSGTHSFLTFYDSSEQLYELRDTHGNIFKSTSSDSDIYFSYTPRFGDGKVFTTSNEPDSVNGETAAVDAFYAVNMTWTFFNTILKRDGPNGRGRPMPVRLHYPAANAYYSPSATKPQLLVGYTWLITFPQKPYRVPLTATDILAHELGHDFFWSELSSDGMASDISNTELNGISEGTGDIIGFLTELTRDAIRGGRQPGSIDQMVPQTSNYTLGEQVGQVSRNLLIPTYNEWFDGIGRKDEHESSGPISLMFLRLAYGCEPMPSSGSWTEKNCPRIPEGFAGIGPVRAARIWALTLAAIPMGADYLQTREQALEVARQEDSVTGEQQRKAVAYAFAAIAVGGRPDVDPPQTTLSCQQVGLDLQCTGSVTDTGQIPSEPLRPAQLSVRGTSLKNALLDWQFTQTFPGTSLSTASYVIELKAWDGWNNAATRTVTVAFDKSGPQATLSRLGTPKQPLLSVTATDPSGVLKVEFLEGTQLLATVLTPPYDKTFDTSTWSDGTHAMVAKVYDRFNNVTVLNHALLVDNTRPVVTLTVGGGTTPPFPVSATATDASALVRADFKVEGLIFATRTSGSPYSATYSPVDPLPHNLTVEVTDSFGNKGTATVAAPLDKAPPAVTFSAQQGYTGIMTLTVGTSDTCGVQYPYALYVDGTLVGQPTTPGYVVVMASEAVSVGVHAFQALVRDNCGNLTQFQTTFSKVYTPPGISSITRDDTQPKKPKFTVQCNDFDGVHHVEMRENGVVLLSDSTPPYEFVVDTTTRADRDYPVLFQCFDVYGAWSPAESRTVTADNTAPVIQGFTMYGSGHSYQVAVSTISDPRGIKTVVLRGGLAVDPMFRTTLTQPPWFYNLFFDASLDLDTSYAVWVDATDKWGNMRTDLYFCPLDTDTTQNAYLPCTLYGSQTQSSQLQAYVPLSWGG